MAQQSSGEFPTTDPTQDARCQMSGFSQKISLNSRSHLQHFQRPTSSHFCKDAPSLSRVGTINPETERRDIAAERYKTSRAAKLSSFHRGLRRRAAARSQG